MQKSENEVEKLQALQREAAELRAERKQAKQSDDISDAAAELESQGERLIEKVYEAEKKLEKNAEQAFNNLAERVETAVTEIEDVTRKRPAVALLTAVTVGIVIGQLFSRR